MSSENTVSYFNFKEKLATLTESSSQEAERRERERVEEKIEIIEKSVLSLYWEVQNSRHFITVSQDKHSELVKITELIESCQKIMNSQTTVLVSENKHINNHPVTRGGTGIKKLASFFPFLALEEVSKSMSDFASTPSLKLLLVLLGAVITLVFGEFSTIGWVFVLLTVTHFISRQWANSQRESNDYIKFSKSIQVFILPYFWLAIGNGLSYVVTLNGLPEGTFYALLVMWLIWGELKGTVENMKIAKLPVPSILEKLVNSNKDQDTPM